MTSAREKRQRLFKQLLPIQAVAQTTVRAAIEHPWMPQNFLACNREQSLLLAPDLRDWLPEDHLALFVIDAVAALAELISTCAHLRAEQASGDGDAWIHAVRRLGGKPDSEAVEGALLAHAGRVG